MANTVQSIEVCETHLYYTYIMLYNIIITYYIYCISLIIVILKSDMKKTRHIKKLRVTQAGSFDK